MEILSEMNCREQFILFGDSLIERAAIESEGFQFTNRLENVLSGRYEIVVHGFPGANTYHALDYLKKVMPTPENATVRFLAIWFGTNDADQSRRVSIDDFERNLISIVNSPQVRAHLPNIKIILITPPPIEESLLVEHKKKKYGIEGPPHMTAESAAQYAEKIRELAQKLKSPTQKQTCEDYSFQSERGSELSQRIEVLDVWHEFMSTTGWREGTLPGSTKGSRNEILSELLVDGVHLTSAGYKVVLSTLHNLLRNKWTHLVCG